MVAIFLFKSTYFEHKLKRQKYEVSPDRYWEWLYFEAFFVRILLMTFFAFIVLGILTILAKKKMVKK